MGMALFVNGVGKTSTANLPDKPQLGINARLIAGLDTYQVMPGIPETNTRQLVTLTESSCEEYNPVSGRGYKRLKLSNRLSRC